MIHCTYLNNYNNQEFSGKQVLLWQCRCGTITHPAFANSVDSVFGTNQTLGDFLKPADKTIFK